MKNSFKTLIHTSSKLKGKPVTNIELNLKSTLINGQCFFWHPIPNKKLKLFAGVYKNSHIYFQENDKGLIEFCEFPEIPSINQDLNDYFQLGVDMGELIKFWNLQDDHFNSVSEKIQGLRILRQDPLACLISFLCSQNNNISRITQMISNLTSKYGNFICERDDIKYYSFPTLKQLSDIKEADLREMGFGYRANYIVESVKKINEKGGVDWLDGLRGKEKKEIRDELLSLKGIGLKVADCIALFSLDCNNSIPVDTHIWQIYQKVYKKDKKEMKLNKANYDHISDFFEKKFQKYAGWAHSLLFTADLPEFKEEMNGEAKRKKTKKINKLDNDELFESCNVKELETKRPKRK